MLLLSIPHLALIRGYVIKFVRDLRRVVVFFGQSGFLHQLIWSPRYKWNSVESELLFFQQVLYNFVHKCLEEANKRSVRSICFPALGTGFLKFPAKTAASNVINAIKDFQIKNPSSSIRNIYIVIKLVLDNNHKTIKYNIVVIGERT
jgi:hypothetical protein